MIPEIPPLDGVHPVPQFPPHVTETAVKYLPAAQSLQIEDPAAEYVPAITQLVQLVAPAAERVLEGQSTQVALLVCAVEDEYFPPVQLVQLEAPDAENVPGIQLTQEAELVCALEDENVPATQWVQIEAASAECVPATQFVHMEAPASEYLPARHCLQARLLKDLLWTLNIPA